MLFQEIPIGQLQPSPLNPRKHFDQVKLEELAASIAGVGIIEPLVVRSNGKAGAFEIVAGARRYLAAKLAKLETVPSIVRELTDEQVLEIMVVENNQRTDTNPLEEGDGFARLLKLGYELDHLAYRIGRSKKYIYDRIKLLDLVPTAKQLLLDNRMTAGHGILLARLKPADQALALEPQNGAVFTHEAVGSEIEEDDKDPYAGLKPKSVRETNLWIANHVRLDLAYAAQAAPLEFGDTAAQAVDAALRPGRGKKLISITFGHVAPDATRSEDERTYGNTAFQFADGQEHRDGSRGTTAVAPTCEYSVLGVVVAGVEHYGQAFEVCIARDKCQVHWKKAIATKQKNAKLRETGQTAKAEKAEAAEGVRRRREREAEDCKHREWEKTFPGLKASALNAARAMKTVAGPAYIALLKHLRLSTSLPPDRLAQALLVQATEMEFRGGWYGDEPRMRAWAKALGVKDPDQATVAGPAKAKPAKKAKPVHTSARKKKR